MKKIAILASLIMATFTVAPANTHTAPTGWQYDLGCCSNADCRQIKDTDISTTDKGYVIKATGELLIYGDKKIKPSPDGAYHRCSVKGEDKTRTFCLYVPPPGS